MAPEYPYRGEISTMSDIYSLGMIIIEITIREKNCAVSDPQDKAARKFVDIVTQLYLAEASCLGSFHSFS